MLPGESYESKSLRSCQFNALNENCRLEEFHAIVNWDVSGIGLFPTDAANPAEDNI